MQLRQMITVLLSLSAVSYSLTIESTSSGGNWNDTLTWVGYTIPGQNDDVIIKGTVSVTSGATCNNLTINEGNVLQNGGGLGWVVLNINGNITNNGTIQNNPTANELWINIGGDVVNNGVWKCAKTGFMSNKIQHISQASDVEFCGGLQKCHTDGSGDTFPLVATSDIVINASHFSGQGYDTAYFWGVFDLGGNSLTLKGSTQLYYTSFRNVNKLIGLDSTTVRSISVTNEITLAGRITLVDGNVTFYNDATVSDTLQNGGGLGWVTPKFKAKITNNGVIRNNPKGNALWLDCYGDVINNGKWFPEKTFFASTQVQHISHAAGAEFNGNLLKISEAGTSDTFPLVASSDIVFNVNSFDAQGYKDGTSFWGIFDMNGHSLTLRGPTLLARSVLKNVTTLISRDSSVVQSISVNDSIAIAGSLTLIDGNVTFNGNVTIIDTLQNGGNLVWLTPKFKGKITNNGVIRNNPRGNELWLDLYGDVVNNGVWKPAKTFLGSTAVQYISQAAGVEFTGVLQKKNSDGISDTFPLVALSNIAVNASEFSCEGYKDNYFWGIFDLNRHSLTLAGATPLYRAVIKNVDTLYCNDSSAISSTVFDGPLSIGGNFTITNSDVYFNGLVTVTSVLQNGGGLGWVTLNVNKGIVNNGTIRNNPKGNELWIAVRGNIDNYGVWTNKKTTLIDSVDQVINVAGGKNITAPVIFDSRWSSGPYQWQKNGENWGGTGSSLQFDTVSESSVGVYLCKKGDSLSRTITITSGGSVPVQPQIGPVASIAEIPFGWNLIGLNKLYFTIQTPVVCAYKLKLFTANGRQVFQYNGIAPRGKQLIPLSVRASGFWLASFESGKIKETRKVLISK